MGCIIIINIFLRVTREKTQKNLDGKNPYIYEQISHYEIMGLWLGL